MNAKEFRREVGKEIKRIQKLQKEKRTNARRYYLRVLRSVYDMFGITPEKLSIMNPKLRAEAMIYIQGIVDWTEFLLTIQPEHTQNRKIVNGVEYHTSEQKVRKE